MQLIALQCDFSSKIKHFVTLSSFRNFSARGFHIVLGFLARYLRYLVECISMNI